MLFAIPFPSKTCMFETFEGKCKVGGLCMHSASTTPPTSYNCRHGTCSFISHLNSPGELTARLPFSAHITNHTDTVTNTHARAPSLSYQVPTYSWVSRVHVWMEYLTQEHNATAQSSQRLKPAIICLQVALADTVPRRPLDH